MGMLLGALAFAAFVFAVAAVVAVHTERNTRRSDAFDGIRRDHRARAIWDSGS
jgi:hypothetical protein